jgi:hypothetical protein
MPVPSLERHFIILMLWLLAGDIYALNTAERVRFKSSGTGWLGGKMGVGQEMNS